MARAGRLALTTTGAYLDAHFRDSKLKAVLASQWIAYGEVPSKSAFGMHAAVVRHYMQGGYFPDGGAGQIAGTIAPVIARAGGALLVNHEVTKIIVENGRAVGVEAKTRHRGVDVTKAFRAAHVVSGAGAYTTFAKLLPPEVGAGYAKRLKGLLTPNSAVSLYLGLKTDPRTLGFAGENHWIFDGYDHEVHPNGAGLMAGRATSGHLSFPSLKNGKDGPHTVEFFAMVEFDQFKDWADQPWKNRGADYEALKAQISAGMLDLIEQRYPGFRDLVAYQELSTPLSVAHFTAHPNGAIYGLPGVPEKFTEHALKPRTHVPGLYLTGADILCVGIVPSLLTGVATAGALIGPFGFPRVLGAVMRRKASA